MIRAPLGFLMIVGVAIVLFTSGCKQDDHGRFHPKLVEPSQAQVDKRFNECMAFAIKDVRPEEVIVHDWAIDAEACKNIAYHSAHMDVNYGKTD
jgi:hypothetical protein